MQGRRARCLDCISSIQSLAVWTLARRTIGRSMRRMSMLGARVRARSGEGFGRRFGVFLAGPCRESASLLSVHVCRSFDPLDLQDRTVKEKLTVEVT